MAVYITSPVQGTLKIQNTTTTPYAAASPQSMYWCNLETVNVQGYLNPPEQFVQLVNELNQTIAQWQLAAIAGIAASVPSQYPTLQNAVDAIASLIYH